MLARRKQKQRNPQTILLSIAGNVRSLDVVLEPVLQEVDKSIIDLGSSLELTELGGGGGKELLVLSLKTTTNKTLIASSMVISTYNVSSGESELLLIGEVLNDESSKILEGLNGLLGSNGIDGGKETCEGTRV